MRAGQVALITAGAAVTGALGYAIYFDYMRRNSPQFRKGLRKQKKRVAARAEAKAQEQAVRDQRELTLALVELELEQPPSTPEAMEAYFQEHVATAEGLAAQGAEHYVKAATHFYRALRVYPQPVELLMIYQKVCPEPVFQLVLKLTQLSSAANTGGAAAVQRVATGAGVTAIEEEDTIDDAAPAAAAAPVSPAAPVEAVVEEAVVEAVEEAVEEAVVEAVEEAVVEAVPEEAEKSEKKEDEETDEEKEDTASHPSSGASWEKVAEEN